MYWRKAVSYTHLDVYKRQDILVFHTINHIYQAIGLTIQIRLVNLLDISRKYHLRTFACTGDDCLFYVAENIDMTLFERTVCILNIGL